MLHGIFFVTLQPKAEKLEDQPWFHGVLPREEVNRLLNEDGDYLVRESKNRETSEIQYVLSVMWGKHKHFIIQRADVSDSRGSFSMGSLVVTFVMIGHIGKRGYFKSWKRNEIPNVLNAVSPGFLSHVWG